VAGFVFCKDEAMRRKNREKSPVGFRKRKAGRTGKKQRSGIYVKEQNEVREKLLVNKCYLYEVYNSPAAPAL